MPQDGRLPETHSGAGPAPAEAALIAIASTFTAEGIGPALEFWIRRLGLPYAVRFAPYNQVFQQLLDPAGTLARNTGGVNVALVRFEDWGPGATQHAERLAEAAAHPPPHRGGHPQPRP
jgi:hypothetical protein